MFIPLKDAVLCVECDVVSTSTTNCDKCGNSTLLSLSKVLDRPNKLEEYLDQVTKKGTA